MHSWHCFQLIQAQHQQANTSASAGNATAMAALISASMLLDVTQHDVVASVLYGNNTLLQDGFTHDTTNQTSQQIAQAILHANVSAQELNQALVLATAQSIGDISSGSDPAIIIQATVLANRTDTVTTALEMVSTCN